MLTVLWIGSGRLFFAIAVIRSMIGMSTGSLLPSVEAFEADDMRVWQCRKQLTL